jgi:hypothetical protein
VVAPKVMGGCSLLAAPYHNFAYSAEARVPLRQMEPMPLDERKIIAYRASFGEIAARGPGVMKGYSRCAVLKVRLSSRKSPVQYNQSIPIEA